MNKVKAGILVAGVFASLMIGKLCAQAPTQQLANDSTMKNTSQRYERMEGVVVHICGVDGRKLKLRTDDGSIVKVAPHDSLSAFAPSLLGKRVSVEGYAYRQRTEKGYLDSLEQAQALLCHIDHTPCADTAWVNDKQRSGSAAAIVKRDADRLREQMAATGSDHITLTTIVAQSIIPVDKPIATKGEE